MLTVGTMFYFLDLYILLAKWGSQRGVALLARWLVEWEGKKNIRRVVSSEDPLAKWGRYNIVLELNTAKGPCGKPDSAVKFSLLAQIYFSWKEKAYRISIKWFHPQKWEKVVLADSWYIETTFSTKGTIKRLCCKANSCLVLTQKGIRRGSINSHGKNLIYSCFWNIFTQVYLDVSFILEIHIAYKNNKATLNWG